MRGSELVSQLEQHIVAVQKLNGPDAEQLRAMDILDAIVKE